MSSMESLSMKETLSKYQEEIKQLKRQLSNQEDVSASRCADLTLEISRMRKIQNESFLSTINSSQNKQNQSKNQQNQFNNQMNNQENSTEKNSTENAQILELSALLKKREDEFSDHIQTEQSNRARQIFISEELESENQELRGKIKELRSKIYTATDQYEALEQHALTLEILVNGTGPGSEKNYQRNLGNQGQGQGNQGSNHGQGNQGQSEGQRWGQGQGQGQGNQGSHGQGQSSSEISRQITGSEKSERSERSQDIIRGSWRAHTTRPHTHTLTHRWNSSNSEDSTQDPAITIAELNCQLQEREIELLEKQELFTNGFVRLEKEQENLRELLTVAEVGIADRDNRIASLKSTQENDSRSDFRNDVRNDVSVSLSQSQSQSQSVSLSLPLDRTIDTLESTALSELIDELQLSLTQRDKEISTQNKEISTLKELLDTKKQTRKDEKNASMELKNEVLELLTLVRNGRDELTEKKVEMQRMVEILGDYQRRETIAAGRLAEVVSQLEGQGSLVDEKERALKVCTGTD